MSHHHLLVCLDDGGPAREHLQIVELENGKKGGKPLVGHLGAGLVPSGLFKPCQIQFYSTERMFTHQLRRRSAHCFRVSLRKAWESHLAIRVISHCSEVGNLFPLVNDLWRQSEELHKTRWRWKRVVVSHCVESVRIFILVKDMCPTIIVTVTVARSSRNCFHPIR